MDAVFVQLNNRCNARCVNCPHPFTYAKEPPRSMSDVTWESLMGSLRDFTGQIGLYLHFEPLTEPTLFDKLQDIRESKAYAVVSTNCSLLDEEKALRLMQSGAVVYFNINSGDPEQYERMTGLSFDRTIANARRYLDMGGKAEVNCPVMPDTDVESLVRLFPDTVVHRYWANSRGGLLPLRSRGPSRFVLDSYCTQPSLNRCVLLDGSEIACCMDWAHESQGDDFSALQAEFARGDYSRYRMCAHCASEHWGLDEPIRDQ